MEFQKFDIEGIVLCKPKIIVDERGFFAETFRKDLLEEFISNKITFCQQNTSKSSFGVLRGLHFQDVPFSQTKLISVSNGEILDVIVDLRKQSSTFSQVFSILLNDKNNFQLLIPKGFAHGFIVTTKEAKINYQVDSYYNKNYELGINPFDEALNIDWKIDRKEIVCNSRDLNWPTIEDIDKNLKF